mgnify:FL=1
MKREIYVDMEENRQLHISIELTGVSEPEDGAIFTRYDDNKAEHGREAGIGFDELCSEYLKYYAEPNLKQSTVAAYETAIYKYLVPMLGNTDIGILDSDMLTEMLTNVHFAGKFRTADSYYTAADTLLTSTKLKMLHYVLKSVMKYAVSKHYIKKNPCIEVILPMRAKTIDTRKKYLEDYEIHKFLALFEGYSLTNVAVKMLLFTGMRSGELLGLKWSDIDFKAHRISISRTLTHVNGEYILTSPKSEAGRRTIYMNKTVESLLKEHRQNQRFQRKTGNDAVFTTGSGGYVLRQSLNRAFHKATRGTRFANMSLHCLRHCNATMLLNNGVDLKIVSEHLGHSQISTTANIYTNVTEESRRKIARVMEKKLSQ